MSAYWIAKCKYCEKREKLKSVTTNHENPPAKTPKEVYGVWSYDKCEDSPTGKHTWVWERYYL